MTDNFAERILKLLTPDLSNIGVQLQWQKRTEFTKEENTILMTTPHSFKGYDSEIVVIAGADKFASRKEVFARSLYVAMTRARSILYVYAKNHKRDSTAKEIVEALRENSEYIV